MTLTLDWRHNFTTVMSKAKEQANALYRSLATGGQVVKLAETVLRPGIASSFSVAPFTPLQIKMLDSVMVGVYKRAYRQRRSTPSAAVHEDPNRFGMGCASLLVGYAHEATKQLTEAYNDGGAYGIITRSLLKLQARTLGGLDAGELGAVAMRHLRVRQLSAVRDSKLQLINMEASTSVDLEGTDLYRIVTAVREAAGGRLADAASQRILLPLLQLGMRHITDVLNPDCTWVMGAADLRLKFGSRRVKTKHVHAIYKLAYLLHEGTPGKVCTDKALLTRDAVEGAGARRIAAVHIPALRAAPETEHQLNTLRNVIAPTRHTKQERTIPDALSNYTSVAQHTTTIALDLTQPRRKRVRRDPRAAGHRSAITTPIGGHAGERAQPAARAYLARSERAALMDEPDQRMALLPPMHNLVDHIEAERWCNAHTDANSRKRHQAVQSQLQYLVHWRPTIEEQWSLDAHMQLGYTPLACKPVTFDELCGTAGLRARERDLYAELYGRITCELCDSHESGGIKGDMLICDSCNRMYHTECTDTQPEDVRARDQLWHCDCCAHGEGTERQLYMVSWQPHWEPADGVPESLVGRYRRHRLRANAARQHRPRKPPAPGPAGATNLQNQGVYGGPRFKTSLGSATRGLLTITHQPINPHTDIVATNRFVVEVRTVHTRHQGGKNRPAADVAYEAACVYGPDGRCVGQMEPARLYTLY
jgi:hypothetical protein